MNNQIIRRKNTKSTKQEGKRENQQRVCLGVDAPMTQFLPAKPHCRIQIRKMGKK